MLKLILLLCMALASCHPWPFSSGERSSNSNPVYVDQGALNAGNLQNYLQYFVNQATDIAQQQPQQISPELDTQQYAAQQTTTNHGTKGIGGLFNRNKSNQQQQSPQQQILLSNQPENIFNYGHVEMVPTITNATDNKAKSNRFRAILPWNWVFSSSSSVTSNSDSAQHQTQGLGQQAVPKRSWNPFSRQTYVPNQPNQYCQCYPFSVQPYPPSVQTYIPGGDSSSDSNVRPIEPSSDYYHEGSNPIPTVVSAPSQITDGQQQAQQQQPQPQNQPQVGPTGTNEQLATHHQVVSSQQQQQPQIASQPIQYTVPYQGNTSPYASNGNTQSVPASTNYPLSAVESAQNGQVSSSGN